MSNLEFLLKGINISLSILFTSANLYALYRIVKSPFKTTRNSRWLLFSQISNIILHPVICGFTLKSEQYLDKGALLAWPDIVLANLQLVTIILNVLSGVMLGIDVLCIFVVFDARIEKVVSYLRGIMACNFGVFGIVSIGLNTLSNLTPSDLIDVLLIVSLVIYAGIGLVYDNCASFYLAFLVFRNAKSKNVDRKVRLFRNSVLMILVTCLFDWLCLVGFAYNGLASEFGVFVINLVVGYSAAHIATIALVLINLQHLALDHVLEKRNRKALEKGKSPDPSLDVAPRHSLRDTAPRDTLKEIGIEMKVMNHLKMKSFSDGMKGGKKVVPGSADPGNSETEKDTVQLG